MTTPNVSPRLPRGRRRRRRGRRRTRGLAVASLAVGALLLLLGAQPASQHLGAASAAAGDPWTVTATPTTNLVAGQRVTINVKAAAGTTVYQASARVCRPGVAYQSSTASRPADDVRQGGANCPSVPISSGADIESHGINLPVTASSPAGGTFTNKVGLGPVSWVDLNDPLQPTYSLTCDPTHPCALVVEVYAGPTGLAPTWIPSVTQLSYENADPISGCGGPANGILTSSGTDALSDAWINWTLAQCHLPGHSGAASTMSFGAESDAVQRFASGQLDMAYSAAGYDPDVGLVPAASVPGVPRAAVAVPVGLGAETVGVGNGYGAPDGTKLPYDTVKLTSPETAVLLSGGQFGLTDTWLQPIYQRNSELDPSLNGNTTFFVLSADNFQVGLPSDASASTYYLTRYLSGAAPADWKVPDVGTFGTDAGKPRGIFDSFATADPNFNALSTYTGRPALDKSLNAIVSNATQYGGVWVVSDFTTAVAEGLTPVAIQNPGGQFVAPSAASMDAAVASMKPDADGLLQPAALPTDPAAYPLTYVVYALVPAQPLVDATCTPRTDSQALLHDWLTYLTTSGQQNLPAGLEPLPASILPQAAAAIAKVGATPNTCTPPPAAPAPAAPPAATPTGAAGGSAGSVPAGAVPPPAVPSSSAVASGPAPAPAKASLATASTPVPPYGGSGSASGIETVTALLAVVALTSFAAWMSPKRRRASAAVSAQPGPAAP